MTVYLLHFDKPYISSGGKKRPQHYLGATSLPLAERLQRHDTNRGAALLRAAKAQGVTWTVARTWTCPSKHAAFNKEIALKRRRQHSAFCPICREQLNGTR